MELYLSSNDYKSFEVPRRVTDYKKIKLGTRNVLQIEVAEPLIGQSYGFGGTDITTFYLVNRFDESAFEKLNEFPIDVHVLIVKNPETKKPSSFDELRNIAWACLYDNAKDAKYHKR